MIEKLTYIESEILNPYNNLALEEELFFDVEENECILYLWQNEQTVVIGKNQNPWKECLVNKLKNEGGYLARRDSGGGAVFHDVGNLNFTFLVKKQNYDVDKQLQVIVLAINKLGIRAEKTGRNDITVLDKKISGNAFFEKDNFCYHHGTLMVDVNKQDLSKYLTVSKEKLQAKGVDSVRTRVANLKEFYPDITIEKLKKSLKYSFEEVYGLCSKRKNTSDFSQPSIKKRQEKFESWDWIFGRKMEFQFELHKFFSWGDITFLIQVNKGLISDVKVQTDAMNPILPEKIGNCLVGVPYENNAMVTRIQEINVLDKYEETVLEDIKYFIESIEL